MQNIEYTQLLEIYKNIYGGLQDVFIQFLKTAGIQVITRRQNQTTRTEKRGQKCQVTF